MSGQQLVTGLADSLDEAEAAIDQMVPLGKAKARIEREYRVAKAKRIAALREKGTPVTIIGDLVKGDEAISLLAYKRDCADVVYQANHEAVLLAKKRADSFKEIIAREWNRGDGR